MAVVPARLRHPRRRAALAALAATSLASAALVVATGPVAAQPGPARSADAVAAESGAAASGSDRTDFYDSRQDPASTKVLKARADISAARPRAGVKTLRATLGTQGVIDIDPLTGTPRQVAQLDGFLTGPSGSAASSVALGYVRSHADAFGLTAADLATLHLRRDYVDVAGTHHLSWTQKAGAVTVFGNGLKANVTKDGRLINVQGSPVRSVPSLAVTPSVSAGQARTRAVADVDGAAASATSRRSADGLTTTFSNGDQAKLVAFQAVPGARLAWQTITRPAKGKLFMHVLDAGTGRVLYRRDLVQADSGPTALVHESYPGAPLGGKQKSVNLGQKGWLPATATTLDGRFVHSYTDVNDDNVAQPTEEVTVRPNLKFPLVNFNAAVGAPCATAYPCTWDPSTPFSWQANREQNAVQVFYFVSKFHDHLNSKPIGFTRAAGNFDAKDGDAIQAQPDDGADTAGSAGGLPDSGHVDNANMGTPPDGFAPTMQMYLFHDPADPTDPFIAANGGDEADIVYHEYTHGLSNRLVVDANGLSTLGGVQAGSMGEAWSDWYAFDFLVNSGYQVDRGSRPGDVLVGSYVSAGQNFIRTEPIDCPVGTTSAACPGTPGAGPGGYTYGDFGNVIGFPEVHADGEIWAQTLWDLRRRLGAPLAESLITRAMELAPANPSFLDMRNSILQADMVVHGGRAYTNIWKAFAKRGMGWFAGSIDGDDTAPVEDFSLPPSPNTPTGTLTGVVTDDASGAPIAGAAVRFGGHASGFPGDYAATTAADGSYTIGGILAGTYPSVTAGGSAGYDPQVATVSVPSGSTTRNWVLRRDWAALSGGSSVADTNGDEFAAFGCGAAAAIDQSTGTGWSAFRELVGTSVTPKFVVVQLPAAVDVTEITVDPSGNCGDAGSASTGPYTIETSADGVTYAVAASGTFTPADRGHFSSIAPATGTGTGVRYIRYTMLDSQVNQVGSCPGPFSGCDFIDTTELAVYGTPAA